MNTAAENMAFIIIRGLVALAIVGMGFYCIAQGIHFFSLPRVEAEQIRIHIVGLDITANGLGAVIFGTGLALCWVGKRTAPNRIETTRTSETSAVLATAIRPAESAPEAPILVSEKVVVSDQPVPTQPTLTRVSEAVRIVEGPTRERASLPSKDKGPIQL